MHLDRKGPNLPILTSKFVLHRQIAQLFNFQQSKLSIYFKKTHLINTITITDTINACTDTFYVKTDTVLTYKIIKGCVGATPASFKTNACSQPSVTGPDTITYSNDTVTVTAVALPPKVLPETVIAEFTHVEPLVALNASVG